MEIGTAIYLSVGVLVVTFIPVMLWWMARPVKCPRCGARDWVHVPHLGPGTHYCRRCCKFVDFADRRRDT